MGKVLSRNDFKCGDRQEGARFALLILSGINLLNFADRYVPSGVKELIKEDLNLTDAETSIPTTGMVFVYMIFAIIFGWIGDKQLVDRRKLLSLGIFLWSAATALAGLAQNLEQLIIFRSLVGVGEAAYATIAPPMISDFYPHCDRNIAFGIYYLAIPVGSALGFGIGSVIGAIYSWRVAFFVVGLPGVFLSISVLFCNDPVPGLNDENLYSKSTHPLHDNIQNHYNINDSDSDNQKLITKDNNNNNINNNIISESSNSSADSSTSLTNTSSIICHHTNTNTTTSPLVELQTSTTSNINIDTILEEVQYENEITSIQSIKVNNTIKELLQNTKTILTNYYYLFSLAGLICNLFAMGGLAEWFPTFLYRYHDMSIAESGIIIGGSMVIGGIFGNILGAKSTEAISSYVKNPHFYVAAIYTLPATVLLLLAINIDNNKILIIFFIFICIIALFTNLAPMASISITCIHPRLRAYSCSLQIFFQHVLGDMISPVIIGVLSDQLNSLRIALQITWMSVLLSGVFWFIGYFYLIPLEMAGSTLTSSHSSSPITTSKSNNNNSPSLSSPSSSNLTTVHNTTYLELLCGYKSKKNVRQDERKNSDDMTDDITAEMIRLESR